MKKLFALMLSLIMTLSVFAGCGTITVNVETQPTAEEAQADDVTPTSADEVQEAEA